MAEDVLRAILAIEAGYEPGRVTREATRASQDLLRALAALLSSGPAQYRVEVGDVLPLTRRERDLLAAGGLASDARDAERLTARLGAWTSGTPVRVGQRSVHVSQFLRRLWPSLGLWDDRMAVDALIDRTTGLLAGTR